MNLVKCQLILEPEGLDPVNLTGTLNFKEVYESIFSESGDFTIKISDYQKEKIYEMWGIEL